MSRKARQTYETEKDTFPQRLSALMTEIGITQSGLAKELGITRQAISLYANGQSTPDINALYKIAKFFNVSADYLLGLSDSKASDIDNRRIADILGLSDKSVDYLQQGLEFFNEIKMNSIIVRASLNQIIDFLIQHPTIIYYLGDYWLSGFNQEKERELEEAKKQISRIGHSLAVKDNKRIFSPEETLQLMKDEDVDLLTFARLEKYIKKNKEEYLEWIEEEYGKPKKN